MWQEVEQLSLEKLGVSQSLVLKRQRFVAAVAPPADIEQTTWEMFRLSPHTRGQFLSKKAADE